MTHRGLAVFAGLIGVLSVLALSLSVLDGWRPVGGNGVPFVEALIQDTPQAQVDAYLGAVTSGDRTGALGVWQLPDRTSPEVQDLLIQRRMVVTERLTTQRLEVRRIAAIEWWSLCCEPHPVTDQRSATLARITVEIGRAPIERYLFDVGVADPTRSLIDGLARRWILRDVYRSDEQPLLVRWVSNGHGSEYVGPTRPPTVHTTPPPASPPVQTPSARPVGFVLPAGCSFVGTPIVGSDYSQWQFDCGASANRDARGTLAPALTQQGWTSCGVGLGNATWMKAEMRLIVSEGSGVPGPSGLPTLTQPARPGGTACG